MANSKGVILGTDGEVLSVSKDLKWKCVVGRLKEALVRGQHVIGVNLAEAGKPLKQSKLNDLDWARWRKDKEMWRGQRNAYSDICDQIDKLILDYELE